ncbi:LuxR C-terminal-related transcriptional regulator [Yoonia sp. SS1-5]|uniref:LuxR C-terminal-related transcriptional regulator n=1 Tax=Yoonia rhodophyticola TaxID=3137370 RepID=A0ABZ3JCL3_9RHOB
MPREQEIVSLASTGKTDQQIADTLGVSRDAIKQWWSRIYDHVLDVHPDVFWNDSSSCAGEVRGTEKRRSVLAYCASRPSELRPHYLKR